MSPARLRWLAVIAAGVVLAAGYFSLTREVTVLADGRAYELATRAVTVSGALKQLGIVLGQNDAVEPFGLAPVRNGLIIAVHRAAQVQIRADGQIYSTVSAEKNPAALLAEFDLSLAEGDRLLLAGEPISLDAQLPAAPVLALELRRPVAVSVTVDGQTQAFTSSAATLGEALAEAGVEWSEADRLQPAAETPLDAAVTATVVRARPLSIALGDAELQIYSAATIVGEALAEAGIALQGEDYSEPAEDLAVPADGAIRVVRVSESLQLVQEALPHEIEWQPDDTAELDSISVVQLGQDGVQASRVRVRYEDGQEVSRRTEGERILVEPQTQINGYGTKIVVRTTVVDGLTIEYYRAVNVFTTWYSPCNSGVSTCLYGTSSGLPLQKGVIATYLGWYRQLKFATVYIPGYGQGTIGDVGAYPDGRPWVDLAFSDAEAAAGNPWVNSYVTMYFTTPVPAYVPPVWPPG